jgi:hypothetical protein
MADTFPNWFTQAFSRMAVHWAQQRESQLAAGALLRTSDGGPGAAVHFDTLGSLTATLRSTRIAATAAVEPAHGRRRAVLAVYDLAVHIADTDDLMAIISPQSEYPKAVGYAMERQKDLVLIGALGGTAISVAGVYDANQAQTLTNVTLPAGQAIASTADILADLRKVKAQFDRAGVEPTDRYCMASPEMMTAMLGSTPITSSDYNTVKTLVQGEVNSFLGFKFVSSLQTTPTTTVDNYFWHRDGLGLAMARDTRFVTSVRHDLNDATQVRACLVMGAVRIEDARVVKYTLTI